MFKIFEIRGKRFEYSNNIRAQKLSNPNPNIRDLRKKIRIRIESEYIRSPLVLGLIYGRSNFCHKFYYVPHQRPDLLGKIYGKSLSDHKSGPGPPKTIKFGQMGDR